MNRWQLLALWIGVAVACYYLLHVESYSGWTVLENKPVYLMRVDYYGQAMRVAVTLLCTFAAILTLRTRKKPSP